MKISTFRFILYLLISALAIPTITGNDGLWASIAYYLFMLSITALFMYKDGIRWNFWFHSFKTSVIRSLLYLPILFLVLLLVGMLFPFTSLPAQESSENVSTVLLFLVTVVISPFVEELMFRGYIQEYIRGKFKKETTIIVSALIFSLYHPFYIFPYIFVFGVFQSTIREMNGALYPNVIVHTANNLITFVIIKVMGG
ncbi:MAG: CPBP family intramembrane metalloprotease [Thermotogaceae bacterium]|nr:CPBP family intramembrane metalloprotease [Thermotogaceae bacterium]